MSSPLQALRDEYAKLQSEDDKHVWRLAHLDSQMEELVLSEDEAQTDHSGLAQMVGAAPAKNEPEWSKDELTYTNQMLGEYLRRYGREPAKEAVDAAAASLAGKIDPFSADGREAIIERVAQHAGHAQSHRTNVASGRGGGLASRMAAAASGDDNADFLRGLAEQRHNAGVR